MKRLYTIIAGTILLSDAFVLGLYIGAGQWHWSAVVLAISSAMLYVIGLIMISKGKA